MIIFYDHQIFTFQRYGGISRYFYELINLLKNNEDTVIETPFILSNNYYISNNKKNIRHINFLPHQEFRGKNRLMSIFNKRSSIINFKKQKFDIFHPTYYDPYFLKYIGNKPFILTVHDMIHEKFSEMFDRSDKTSIQKKILIQKANKIIAISNNTKKDLMEILNVDESKIEVIYLGNSMFPKNNLILNIDIPQNYILFVGSRSGYKNFDRFIRAVFPLLHKDKNLYVVCAGGGKFQKKEYEFLKQLNILKQVIQFDVNDDILAYLYKNALVFVFPSLYEGFGIPVLEAFTCKCPLVCSNTSSLPEIADGGAVYFDPYDEDSITNAIVNVLENKNIRNNIIKNGTKRLKNFSWRKTATKTKELYQEVLKSS